MVCNFDSASRQFLWYVKVRRNNDTRRRICHEFCHHATAIIHSLEGFERDLRANQQMNLGLPEMPYNWRTWWGGINGRWKRGLFLPATVHGTVRWSDISTVQDREWAGDVSGLIHGIRQESGKTPQKEIGTNHNSSPLFYFQNFHCHRWTVLEQRRYKRMWSLLLGSIQ